MAQANSVQREPSMEEILASIRRIIEDSDTTRKHADEGPLAAAPAEIAQPYADVPAAPDAEPDLQTFELEAFRDELRTAEDAPAKPVSLAQIQAEVTREQRPEPVGREDWEQPVGREAWQQPVARDAWEQPVAPGEPEGFAPVPDEDQDADSAESGETGHAATNQAAPEQAHAPAPVHRESDHSRPAILSDRAGRQVAASFEELSEAFANSRRKSFDEMAEEMLRPMLQDWLDNNLPLLVERLVREEIERVARGGAR